MYAGYLYKRNAPISPPAMQKVYSVLFGTILMDFDSEEDARSNLSPKLICEVLGISEWDGVGRATQYPYGFIAVTHTGETFYLNANSAQEREDWILQVKRGLECNFANPEVAPFKPSKHIQSKPSPKANLFCPHTHAPLSTQTTYMCKGCGRGFSSTEYLQESCTMLQVGQEHAEKVCLDCKNAQLCVYWLKTMNYAHIMALHDHTPSVSSDIHRYKSSFKLSRRQSHRLDMAAKLYEKEQITLEEFEELRRVDYDYRREEIFQESKRLRDALDTIGADMPYIVSLLLSPKSSDRGGRESFLQIIMKVLEIADLHPEIIDFYWPQLIQAHLLLSHPVCRWESYVPLAKLDVLQQALLAIALKYPPLGLKLAWALSAVGSDYLEHRGVGVNTSSSSSASNSHSSSGNTSSGNNGNSNNTNSNTNVNNPSYQNHKVVVMTGVSQMQYAAATCLLLQLEMLTTGHVSSIADKPSCKFLQALLRPADHQQQEIGIELSTLFLSRRRMQEVYEQGEVDRKRRNVEKALLYGGVTVAEARQQQMPTNNSTGDSNNSSSGFDNKEDSVSTIGDSKIRDIASDSGNLEGSAGRGGTDVSGSGFINAVVNDSDVSEEEEEGFGGEDKWDDDDASCMYIFHHMGVGRSRRSNRLSHSNSHSNSDSDIYSNNNSDSNSNSISKSNNSSNGNLSGLTGVTPHDGVSGSIVPPVSLPTVSDAVSIHMSKHHADLFSEQLDFMRTLSDLADSLRTVDRPLRTDCLRSSLAKITHFGWDPCFVAGEPCYRVTRILVDECRVFRTKARAPSLIVCEVVRDDLNSSGFLRHCDDNQGGSNDDGITAVQIPDAVNDIPLGHVSDTPAYHHKSPPHSPTHHSSNSSPAKVAQSTQSIVNDEVIEGLVESGISQAIADMSVAHSSAVSESDSNPGCYIDTNSNSTIDLTKTPPRVGSSQQANASTSMQRTLSTASIGGSNSVKAPTRPSLLSAHRKSMTFFSSLESYSQHTNNNNNSISNNSGNSNNNNSSHHSSNGSNNDNISSTATGPTESAAPVTVEASIATADLLPSFPPLSSAASVPASSSSVTTMIAAAMDVPMLSDAQQDVIEVPLFPVPTATVSSPSTSQPQSQPRTVWVKRKVFQSAQNLLASGKIAESEFNMLVMSDSRFRDLSAKDEAFFTLIRVENAYGETWQSKRERILGERRARLTSWSQIVTTGGAAGHISDRGDLFTDSVGEAIEEGKSAPVAAVASISSPTTSSSAISVSTQQLQWPLYDIRAFIVKSNDDLRQEICCLQVMSLCKEIFANLGLDDRFLWLHPYRIVSTGSSTGAVQVIPDSLSLDALKKTPGFTTLPSYFKSTYGTSPESLLNAKRNFASSMAAYSLFCYIMAVKDRHNGNILLDTDGHVIHIDFGFILSIAPGGAFSLETAPFKLTEEMVEVLEGIESPLFGLFVKSFTLGFLALRSHSEMIISVVKMLSQQSPFPCFAGKDCSVVLEKLRGRFRTDLSVKDFVKHCMDLIVSSYGAYGTKQYDSFQWYTNGITP